MASNFTTDLTNTPTSLLLLMLHNHAVFRERLTFNPERDSRPTTPAFNELRAEIDRRIPIPRK
jgi:hypothetical protein